jgi:hypothetical protein
MNPYERNSFRKLTSLQSSTRFQVISDDWERQEVTRSRRMAMLQAKVPRWKLMRTGNGYISLSKAERGPTRRLRQRGPRSKQWSSVASAAVAAGANGVAGGRASKYIGLNSFGLQEASVHFSVARVLLRAQIASSNRAPEKKKATDQWAEHRSSQTHTCVRHPCPLSPREISIAPRAVKGIEGIFQLKMFLSQAIGCLLNEKE